MWPSGDVQGGLGWVLGEAGMVNIVDPNSISKLRTFSCYELIYSGARGRGGLEAD